MGFLHCYNISEAFIKHLDTIGPISVKEAVKLYHAVHEMGYNDSEKGRIDECAWACQVSAFFYVKSLIIEPVDRADMIGKLIGDLYLPEHLKWITESAPTEAINAIIVASELGFGRYTWDSFDKIAWKLTEKALNDRALIKPYWGVDT